MERATSQGVELNPRTLAYYVSIGLVAPPVRAPFSGADGRVRYYSVDALGRLRRIQSLKEQGFSLTQILKVLEGKAGTSLRRLTEAEEEEIRQHPARRLLKALASDELRRLEAEARAQAADGSDAGLQQALRTYYGKLITLSWPDEASDRLVDVFLHNASSRDRERLAANFRPRKETVEAPTPGLYRLARAAGGALMVGRRDRDEIERLLDSASAQVEAIQARHLKARRSIAEEEVRQLFISGLDLYAASFAKLRENLTNRSRASVKDALSLARRAREAIDAVEILVEQRLKLVEILEEP